MHMRRSSHVSDERLVEVCFDRTATTAEEAHLTACDRCSARRSRLELMLREMSDAAAAEADAAFPDERLASQHAKILTRIEQDGRPARVITFPASHASDVRPLRNRPAARWIAGAAAAGLAIGLLAGHLAHDLPSFGRPPAVRATAPTPAPAIRSASGTLNDEQMLVEIESALDGPPQFLRALHDLTPQ